VGVLTTAEVDGLRELKLDWSRLGTPGTVGGDRMRRRWEAFQVFAPVVGMSDREFATFILSAIASGKIAAIEPGIVRRAKNFAGAIRADVKNRRRRVSAEVRKQRRAICAACELYKPKRVMCSHPRCGCNLKRKVTWAASRCPIGRWGADSG